MPDDDALIGWLDARMRAALEQRRFVGATVAIVSGSDLLFSAGYGHADLGAGVAADPATTPFRSGSTNKVMTALLALQLVEEGRLGLDDYITEHLTRYRPPQPFGPVTIWHLLSHSAGFEERFQGSLTRRPLAEVAPPETLRRLWCRQVRPAGQAVQYSNFGFALLGAVLEDTIGSTYRELVTSRILEPLRMGHTGFELPGHLPPGIASEHWVQADGTVRQPRLMPKVPFYLPAGGLFFTVEDVARFLTACLRPDNGVVTPSLHEAMVTPQAGVPGGAARGLAWWLSDTDKGPVFRHGGSTESFDMTMIGLPALDRGLVVMRTGDWDWRLQRGLRAATGRWSPPHDMLDTYSEALAFAAAAGTPIRPMPAPLPLARAGMTPGTYLSVRRAHTTSERLVDLAETGGHRVDDTPVVAVDGVAMTLDEDGSWRDDSASTRVVPVPVQPPRYVRVGSGVLERRRWYDRRAATFGALTGAPALAAAWRFTGAEAALAATVAVTVGIAVAIAVAVQVLWPPVHFRLRSPMSPLLSLLTWALLASVAWCAAASELVTAGLLLPGAAALVRNRVHRPG